MDINLLVESLLEHSIQIIICLIGLYVGFRIFTGGRKKKVDGARIIKLERR